MYIYIYIYVYMLFSMYMCVYITVFMSAYIHICIHMRFNIDVHIPTPQKDQAFNRPGRPFCDKACTRIGGLATNPPCDKPIEVYSTLHRGRRKGFVTEGNPFLESQP